MKLQAFRFFKEPTVIQPQRLNIIIPEFTFAVPAWNGVSELLGAMPLGNTYYFSFKVPIEEFGENFDLAIRWTEGSIQRRAKFWDARGEVLYYPVYAGERIGLSAYLEIWSVDSDEAPLLASSQVLQSSVLAFPQGANCGCCVQPEAEQILEMVEVEPCNPYSYCLAVCEE